MRLRANSGLYSGCWGQIVKYSCAYLYSVPAGRVLWRGGQQLLAAGDGGRLQQGVVQVDGQLRVDVDEMRELLEPGVRLGGLLHRRLL